ncbi:MAG: hypothetical protein KUG65_05460 [Sphingomonadaceae bacterium]|nr:hypothetical protein [Sphingomonadaceae bacterium]
MSLTIALLTPFALLFPVAGQGASLENGNAPRNGEARGPAWEEVQPARPAGDEAVQAASDQPVLVTFQVWPKQFVTRSFFPDSAFQVRIEQSVRIRIAPRPRAQTPAPQVRPNMLVGVPNRALGTNFVERRMGRCLKVKSIAGVQASRGSDLILYLRDRRVVRAQLDRTCRARDFYSGFYLSRSTDGRLCVDRDSLQSRSGANCKLTQMRQLIEAGD